MMKNWKRCLSVVMTLAMLVGVLPTAAFADGEEGGEGGVMPLGGTPTSVTDLEIDFTSYPDGGYTYNGSNQVPGITVKSPTVAGTEDGTLTSDDYTLTFTKAGSTESINEDTIKDAGSYTVRAELTGADFTGFCEETFVINAKELNHENVQISLPNESYVYNGSNQTPTPTVTYVEDEGTVTIPDMNYLVAYENNKDVGTATVKVTFQNNYKLETDSQTVSKTFEITRAEGTPEKLTIGSLTYIGQVLTPVISYDGQALDVSDYEISITRNNAQAELRNAGTYQAQVTLKNYMGADGTPLTVKRDLTVERRTMTDNAQIQVTLPKNTYNRSGFLARPVPTVTDSGVTGSPTLTAGTDYELSYSELAEDAESATVTVTAKEGGNYQGSKEITVTILDDTTAPRIEGVENGKTYHEEKTVTVTDDNLSSVLVNGANPAFTEQTAGKSATFQLAFSNNPYTITAEDVVGNKTEYTVTVKKKPIDSSMIQLDIPTEGYTFKIGEEKKPTVTLKDGDSTIDVADYTVAYSNNINVGKDNVMPTVTVTMNDSSKYQGTASKTFTIKPKALTSAALSGIVDKTYTGSPIEQENLTVKDDTTTLVMGSDKDDTVTYSNNTNPGTAKVTVTLRGNYTGTLEKTFTIGQNLSALIAKIEALAGASDLSYDEKQQIKQLKAAYDALSATDKAYVDSEVGSTLMTSFKNKASAAKFKLLNLPGLGYYRYTKGTSSNVVIKIDAEFGRTLVTEIRMGSNLTVIDPDDYEVKEGSVVVTLKSSFLKTIKTTGKYNLYIDLLDTETGHTETVQTVVRILPATDIVQTGDPFKMNLWIGLLLSLIHI